MEENWSAITAESIYRCMLLFLDHILYRRAHFVRDALYTSRAVLAITICIVLVLVIVLQSSFSGSNIFWTMEICSRHR